MKKRFLSALALMVGLTAFAGEKPLWMRHSTISPDGKEIAFTYKGDIYTVPSTGGRAYQLTTDQAFDGYPIWSKDGKSIAFASDRKGSMDIYLVNREGGKPKRLTTHSGSEIPICFLDEKNIILAWDLVCTQESQW